jgi:hypothetical protein
VYEYHYTGPEVPYARVVRVRKRSTNGFYTEDRERAVEAEVWSDIIRAVGDLQTPEADLWYIENVIKPVIGGAFILPKVRLGPFCVGVVFQCFCLSTLSFSFSSY